MMDRPRNLKVGDDATLVRRLERQDGVVSTLAWSPDGKRIAIAGSAPQVNLYDAETGDRLAACQGHVAGIYATAFSPDGSRLATGGFDGSVRIYKTADGSLEKQFIPVTIEPASSGGAQ
jgi:WD40 repeat protein